MKDFGFKDAPLGFIVGEAELVDVKKYNNKEDFENDKNKHLASEDWGSYGFILGNVKRIVPIKANGKLGFWDFN
jgi:hypothetical protein